jgi:hypothetical protein
MLAVKCLYNHEHGSKKVLKRALLKCQLCLRWEAIQISKRNLKESLRYISCKNLSR